MNHILDFEVELILLKVFYFDLHNLNKQLFHTYNKLLKKV